MIKVLPNEEWKVFEEAEGKLKGRYAVSSKGRIASYKKTLEEGKILKGALTVGYPAIRMRLKDGTKRLFYIHRLMAQLFLPSPTNGEKIVIHLDHMKMNNELSNLKWATKKEKEAHQMKSPFHLIGIQKRIDRKTVQGRKLHIDQVVKIKKLIANPKRKMKLKEIAKQYNISEMQLYRIKNGTNWGHVKI